MWDLVKMQVKFSSSGAGLETTFQLPGAAHTAGPGLHLSDMRELCG